MPWQELNELADTRIPEDVRAVINRRIRTMLTFRAKVDAPAPVDTASPSTPRLYAPEDARNEALRRELFIRKDMLRIAEVYGCDVQTHAAAYQSAQKALDDAQGHYPKVQHPGFVRLTRKHDGVRA